MMAPMRIVADANIAYVRDAFFALGEVVTLPAAALTREAARDADVLLVRSTVKVNQALLEGSRVRFLATATIGIDHLDVAFLDGAGNRWASAPGSNADSVVQWFAAAMLRLPDIERRRLGIVGVGNVGGRIERLWRTLAVPPPLLCDPPRQRREGAALSRAKPESEVGHPTAFDSGAFVTLDEILARCDLLTLHVPLTRDGVDATHHLLDARRLPHGTARSSSTCSKVSRAPTRISLLERSWRRRISPGTRSTVKPTAPR
jgi:erythronate-4-phosphate dehydrogenase